MSGDPLLESGPRGVESVTGLNDVRNQPTLLTQKAICDRLDISDETWRRWVRSGKAPQPLPGFPKRRPRWSLRSIERYESVGQEPTDADVR